MISQLDFGAGYAGNVTIPAGCGRMVVWENGPGAGGGAGSSGSAGGGGGSGVKNMMNFVGSLAGKVLALSIPVGGVGGVAPNGNGHAAIGHTTLTFDNGWQWIAGGGNFGYGGSGSAPGPGGAGGNTAVTSTAPAYVTSYGQFNLGSVNGMDGTARLYGLGGDQGDSGGGGQGGWWNANGSPGIGGYIHIEFYID